MDFFSSLRGAGFLAVLVIALLSLAVLVIVFLYRLSKPHSRKIKQQQAHINSRVGVQQPVTPTGNTAHLPARPVRGYGWMWTVILAITALGVLYFWIYKDPAWSSMGGAAEVNRWALNHWVGILVFAGILWVLVELNSADLGGAAHVLRQMLLWGVFALFIGTWLLGVFNGTPSQPRNKVDVLEMSANGKSAHVSAPPGYAASFTGNGFTTHCVYTDGSEGIVGDTERPCVDGPMLYQYVRDTTGRANAVTYKFVRP